MSKVRFNEIHMKEIEDAFRKTQIDLETDVIPLEICEILQTFRFAMEEGSECIAHVSHKQSYIDRMLRIVHGYCKPRNIDYEVAIENDMYMLHLN